MDTLSKLSLGPSGWGDELLIGALMTVSLAVASLIIGLIIGGVLALCKIQPITILRGFAHGLTLLFRGMPEFLVILVVFFGLDILINILLSSVAMDLEISTPKFWAGALGLGLIFGVYASEVFKGAYYAVPKGVLEASHALGLSDFQTTTQIHIPLMWRYALPGLMNLWLVLLKDTSLVAVIAFDELLRTAKVAGETEREPFIFFLAAGVLYLLMTWVSDQAKIRLENRVSLAGRN
ncbi:MAG TPA: histidine transporter permease HisQ [Gammaproteobacteria bacterium]|nr:histidine transporter permease HisQ [Gammaproteobacteria bacterium]HBX27017.1 histidine transporter permease HisQ [Gammaproteobacteria bacterium]